MAGVNSKVSQMHDDNLETFSIFWLDAQVTALDDYRKTQKRLQQIINNLKIFEHEKQCQQCILSLSPQNRLILIISGRCGRQLVPPIHHLRQLSSIYVYDTNKRANEQWIKNFTKVKSLIVRTDDLINQIEEDQKSRMKIEEPLSINFFTDSDNPDQSTVELNGHFVYSLLLIVVLLGMKTIETDEQQLIKLCKTQYQKNDKQLVLVNEFQREYSVDKAIWWYTRDTFLYKILNKALRMQNIDLLFLLRFVINDIYRQLKQIQCQSFIRVYRGLVMSDNELNDLRRSAGNFISINSFFSTSLDRHQAFGFLNSFKTSNGLHRVLFDIDADPHVVTSKPFGDISSVSDIGNKGDILFMIGCVFRLIDIRQDDDEQIWLIKMKLCDDNEHELKKLFDHIKKDYGSGDNGVNILSFGDALREMHKYDLAEKIYRRLINILPSDDPVLSYLYYSLGLLTKYKGEYNSSLEWFEKSLAMNMRSDSPGYISMSSTYIGIGAIYGMKSNNKIALEYYNKAITLFQEAHDDNHPNMAYLYYNIALIYAKERKYLEALEYYRKSLDIRENHLSSDDPIIATTYNNIGCIYYDLRQHDLAMQHYAEALKIPLKSFPSQHPEIGKSYENMGIVYEMKKEWKQALIYYQNAATIYRRLLPPLHPDVLQIGKTIERVSSKQNE